MQRPTCYLEPAHVFFEHNTVCLKTWITDLKNLHDGPGHRVPVLSRYMFNKRKDCYGSPK